MKKENSSKEFYLQKLNKKQSNSQKNPLKFQHSTQVEVKTESNMQEVARVKVTIQQQKLLNVLFTEKKLNKCLKQHNISISMF